MVKSISLDEAKIKTGRTRGDRSSHNRGRSSKGDEHLPFGHRGESDRGPELHKDPHGRNKTSAVGAVVKKSTTPAVADLLDCQAFRRALHEEIPLLPASADRAKSVLERRRRHVVSLVEPLPEASAAPGDEHRLSLEVRGSASATFGQPSRRRPCGPKL
jgi:hypothetical protein